MGGPRHPLCYVSRKFSLVLSTDAYNLGVRIKEKLDMSTDKDRTAYERLCAKMTAAGSVAWFLSRRAFLSPAEGPGGLPLRGLVAVTKDKLFKCKERHK